MPGEPDPQYLRARCVLLDAADPLAVRPLGASFEF